MGKKPFIDRKNAKHYHLVHRSQRDPLIVDDEASQRVLKETIPINLMKHMTREEIEATLSKPTEEEEHLDSHIGQAPLYGINFDDADYDYTQHLRNIGEEPDAVFLEAPSKRKEKKPQAGLTFVDEDASTSFQSLKDHNVSVSLPAETLASTMELPVGLLAQPALPDGLQPDMDPRLREVFEALEDEAFVEEELEDGFFSALNAEGEAYVPEEGDDDYDDDEGAWEEYEEGQEGEEGERGGEGHKEMSDTEWKAAFNKFKAQQKRLTGRSEDGEDDKQSRTTGHSMSSSAMFRNEKLTLLDERFEKIEQEYENDSDEDDSDPKIQEREDLEAILDDFLDKYEVVGRKMVPRLEGDTSLAKLETIRAALLEVEDGDVTATTMSTNGRRKKKEKVVEEVEVWERPVKERQAWDVQSVLSTYSNLENHPKTIKEERVRTKIMTDGRTGLPFSVLVKERKENKNEENEANSESESDDNDELGDEGVDRVNRGACRVKGETAEEKKVRKAAIKAEKKNRRVQKKSTKDAFQTEKVRQIKVMQNTRGNQGILHID